LLTRVQSEQAALLPYQYLALTEIHQVTGLGQLFDAAMVFENYPKKRSVISVERAGGLRARNESEADATHYPLTLAAASGPRLRLRLTYRRDLLPHLSLADVAARLESVLAALSDDLDRPLGTLTSPAPARLPVSTIAAASTFVATVPTMVARQATLTPDRVAAVFRDQHLTYARSMRGPISSRTTCPASACTRSRPWSCSLSAR